MSNCFDRFLSLYILRTENLSPHENCRTELTISVIGFNNGDNKIDQSEFQIKTNSPDTASFNKIENECKSSDVKEYRAKLKIWMDLIQ